MLLSYAVSPVNRFFPYARVRLRSDSRWTFTSTKLVLQAQPLTSLLFTGMSVAQYCDCLVSLPFDRLLFASINPSNYYYSILNSFKVLVELIVYQVSVLRFFDLVGDLFNICDKRLPEINSLIVAEPPNSGKITFSTR